MPDISLNTPEFIKLSNGLDPVGITYKGADGEFYRGIKSEAIDWLEDVKRLRILEALSDKKLIPEQTLLPSGNQEYCAVLKSSGGAFNVHTSEYALRAIQDAALSWISINEILAGIDNRFGMIDGHYENLVLFGKTTPKWVDVGSIHYLSTPLQGIMQFMKYFLYPLLVNDAKPEISLLLRNRMRNPKGGMEISEVQALTGLKQFFELTPGMSRSDALKQLRDIISGMKFSKNRDFWSDYRKPVALSDAVNGTYLNRISDLRPQKISDLVRNMKPKTLIDIGANDGLFSILSSVRTDTKVLAVDTDNFSLNKLYAFQKSYGETQTNFDIYIASNGFMNVTQKADVVMALALTHHLVLSQKLSFDDVAKQLARMCSVAAVTEYMPDGLGGTRTHPKVSPNPLPEHYSLEAFLEALKKSFESVEVIDYGREVEFSKRTLILCKTPFAA